jgi:peptidase A4-like protein
MALAVAALAALQLSTNWSGYVASAPAGAPAPLVFTQATGSWRLPKVACTQRGTSAAFWVGVGGSSPSSPALEQLGTSADCEPNGTAEYRAWTEIVPDPANFVSLKVRPGDLITAAVVVQGQTVTMSLTNQTTRKRYSVRVEVQQAVDTSSAEWIAEAPSLCRSQAACDVVPLSNFRRVGFSNVAATANGHMGVLTDPLWLLTPVALVSSSGAAHYTAKSNASGAVPNPIAPGGRAFSIGYRATFTDNVPPAPLPGAPLPRFVH